MHVIMRYQTADKAEAGARRLGTKYGTGRFAVVADADGGTFCPFAVVTFVGYDR